MKGGKAKPVILTYPEGQEVRYNSGGEAARACGLNQTNISEMCRLNISRKGYKARFDTAVPAPAESAPADGNIEG